ncbi:hypothetical protein [Acidisphaera sp. L21]|uniref:hypothetical protein n=1 Tax=Acidisphaera sp. L21 TaxID=1641851 RepID=UPI00131CC62A|nr:hypothetical protein [Acidisphaera sp. L21]
MAAAITLLDGFHRARVAIPVTLHRPTASGHEIVAGKLLGTMHDRGSVLYYRVSVGEGMCYLAPPHWLDPDSQADVALASLATVLACLPNVHPCLAGVHRVPVQRPSCARQATTHGTSRDYVWDVQLPSGGHENKASIQQCSTG